MCDSDAAQLSASYSPGPADPDCSTIFSISSAEADVLELGQALQHLNHPFLHRHPELHALHGWVHASSSLALAYRVGVILVVEYDSAWPLRFEQLRREYAAAMAAAGVPVVAIEHVGSTAVPGLAAKPIIDCDIIVAENDVDAASQTLASARIQGPGSAGHSIAMGVQGAGAARRDEHLRDHGGIPVASQPPRGQRHPEGGPRSSRTVRDGEAASGGRSRQHRRVRPRQERHHPATPHRRGPDTD